VILRGTKRAAAGLALTAFLSGCMAELPGGESGPFAPGNTLTYYYQAVLTDPPEQARIVRDPEGCSSIGRRWGSVRRRSGQQPDNR